jgi:hypothetical protein
LFGYSRVSRNVRGTFTICWIYSRPTTNGKGLDQQVAFVDCEKDFHVETEKMEVKHHWVCFAIINREDETSSSSSSVG